MFGQIYNIENILVDRPEETHLMEGEVAMLNEEIRNIQKAIEENDAIKKTISISLEVIYIMFNIIEKLKIQENHKEDPKQNNC